MWRARATYPDACEKQATSRWVTAYNKSIETIMQSFRALILTNAANSMSTRRSTVRRDAAKAFRYSGAPRGPVRPNVGDQRLPPVKGIALTYRRIPFHPNIPTPRFGIPKRKTLGPYFTTNVISPTESRLRYVEILEGKWRSTFCVSSLRQ